MAFTKEIIAAGAGFTLIIGILTLMTNTTPFSHAQGSTRTTIVNPQGLYDPAPYGYSHAVVADGTSRIAFIAGQGGEDHEGKLPASFDAQVRQAYANLRTALDALGASPSQVVKLTTYPVDYDQTKLDVMTRHVSETFGEALPAQTLVPVPRLAIDGMLFEVDAVVVLD